MAAPLAAAARALARHGYVLVLACGTAILGARLLARSDIGRWARLCFTAMTGYQRGDDRSRLLRPQSHLHLSGYRNVGAMARRL